MEQGFCIHGGHVRTKGKLASLPGDHEPVACNSLGTRQPVQRLGLSTRFVVVSSGMGEYKLFSFFQNTEMNTVTGVNLIDIIGILSGYIEAEAHSIPAVFNWVGKWHKSYP